MIRRQIADAIRLAMADTPVVLLNGARQTGKTTLAQTIAAETGAAFFTFDDAATLGLAAGDPAGFIRQLTGPVVLDEIQKVPALFPAIKLAVDKRRLPGRFLLTGSANVLTLPRLADSLAGRMEIIPLFPFSAGEIAGQQEKFVKRLFAGDFDSPASRRETEDLPARLVQGGFPEAVGRNVQARRDAWFAAYLSTILQRDVRDLAQVEALHALPNLLKLLAARVAGLINIADIGRDAGLPHTTLTRYLSLLETLFLIQRLPAWSPNLGKRLVKAPKLHLLDTGLACHLIGVDATRLANDPPLLGRLLETFVVSELRKQLSWTEPGTTLHHLRTAGGAEVDLVVERPDGSVAGIEVKASATVNNADFAALRELQKHLGRRFRTGVILYRGEQTVPAGDRLWLLPVATLWTV